MNATSTSTTQLRQMFSELSKDGTKTSDMFKEIAGKSFKDFIAEGNNVQDALQLMEKHAQDNDLAINDLFGSIQAGQAALMLTGESSEMFTDNINNMSNAAGATEEAFGTMDDSIKRHIDKISANFEIIKLDIGKKLMPVLDNIVEWVADQIPKIEAGIEAVIDVVKDVTGWVEEHWDILEPILAGIGAGVAVFYAIEGAIALYNVVVGIATGVTGAFGAVLAFITSPIGIVVVAIGALVAAGVALYNNWDKVTEFAGKLWEGIKNVFGKIGEFIGKIWDGVKNVTSKVWNGIKDGVGNVVGKVRDNISNTFGTIKNRISEDWETARKVTSKVWNGMKNSIEEHGGGIKGVVGSLTERIKNDWKKGFDAMDKASGGKLSDIKNKFTERFSSISDGVKNSLDKIKGFFSNLKLKLPKIKLPRFSISGKFSLSPLQVPKLGIDWYDKGGIFTKPSVIGVAEKRPEFVGALDDLKDIFKETLFESMPSIRRNTNSKAVQKPVTVEIGNLINVKGDVSKDTIPDLERLSRQAVDELEDRLMRYVRKSGVTMSVNRLHC